MLARSKANFAFKAIVAVALTAAALAITACNTTKGAGKDIERAGEGIQNSADRHGAQ